jgi:hypothetical protein
MFATKSFQSTSIPPLSDEVLSVLLNESTIAILQAMTPHAFIDTSILIDMSSNSMGLLFAIELADVLAGCE